MSDFFVILVLKTVIYYSKPRRIFILFSDIPDNWNIQRGKLLGFQNFIYLKLEHYESDKTLYTDTK